ncbi:antibiotic biosynthesis monooxygenase [Roseibium denhamense]|uniref:Quinol monooxygenase YgiN n=1 Tax=Roseibium denhamense TaxID=76305 RepID=A0ABY1N6E1_9HYPH|nr:putative quinol monooxygenase [Roseibium denhamense]MTI06105.1 antibiotic biosynthesis monooxygenase [Roseibium denhamense]SMP01152.1 Quinol monooxygenase YgiN [Roseibium denhamense]
MSHYFISAGIELEDGAELEHAEAGLRQLAEQTQAEPGCILFEIRQSLDQPEKFTLWECWESPEALAAHFEADHTKAFLALGLTKINYIEKLGEIGDRTFAGAGNHPS